MPASIGPVVFIAALIALSSALPAAAQDERLQRHGIEQAVGFGRAAFFAAPSTDAAFDDSRHDTSGLNASGELNSAIATLSNSTDTTGRWGWAIEPACTTTQAGAVALTVNSFTRIGSVNEMWAAYIVWGDDDIVWGHSGNSEWLGINSGSRM